MRNRVSLTLDDQTAAALKAAAAQRGTRPTTLASAILGAAICGTPTMPDLTPAPAPASADPSSTEAAPPGERAAWLELDRGAKWRSTAWTAVMDLCRDYPDLGDLVKPGWTDDRFTRDGAIALTVWRQQLDTGKRADPRLEHQWLTALRDFKQMLGARAGHVGAPTRPQTPPDGWT